MEVDMLERHWLMHIEGTPEAPSVCPKDQWVLTFSFQDSDDDVSTHSPDGPQADRASILLPVSLLGDGASSQWSREIAELFTVLEIPTQQRLSFAGRIIAAAQAMANLCCGRGLFSLQAYLWVQDVGPFAGHEPISRGASREAIMRLLQQSREKRDLASRRYDHACSICLEHMTPDGDDELIWMPCDHVFHSPCILRWLETSNKCPLCRYILGD